MNSYGRYITVKPVYHEFSCLTILNKIINIFTTFLQQIRSDRLLLVIIVGAKK